MNIPKAPIYVYIGAGLVAAYAVYRVVDKVLNPNRGTAFEGGGVIGTLGNVANTALGGAPAAIGGAIGSKLYDLVGEDFRNSDTFTFTFEGTSNKGAVEADSVRPDGTFEYYKDGRTYKLRKDAGGKRFAKRV